MFHADRCNFCGNCLTKCQWMSVERKEAIAWQKAMVAGEHSPALEKCITCYACNERCPKKANPFDLHAELQERFRSKVSEDTVNATEAIYAFTGEVKNIPRAGRIMNACSYDKSEAGLLQGALYNLPRTGGKPFFCWDFFWHMGAGSVSKKHTQTFVDRLAQTGAEEVVCFHIGCYMTLVKTAPEINIKVPFRPIHFAEYLVEYLRAHRKSIKPLNLKIAYQRPCTSRLIPDKEYLIDDVFGLTGVERVERKYDREGALCCSAPKLLYNMGDGRVEREKNIFDAQDSGAQALVYLCFVCRNSLTETANEHSLPMIFLGDIVRMALGEIDVPLKNS